MTLDERVQDEKDRAWANVLAKPEGRLVVWSIMEMAGIFRQSYSGNADTNFNEGKRAIGLEILDRYISANGAHLFGEMQVEFAELVEKLTPIEE